MLGGVVAILRLLIGALRDCIMSRGRLEAEVTVLRHQLNMLRSRVAEAGPAKRLRSGDLRLPLSAFPGYRQCHRDYSP